MFKFIRIGLVISLLIAKGDLCSQISKVNHVIDSCVKNGNFNGAVLIAKNDKIELLRYVGLANRHYNIKYSNNSEAV